jgi:uncharacterized protein
VESPHFEFVGSAPQVDIDATIERLLELPEVIAREHQVRAVIVFDEFQEVLELDPTLPGLMRAVFQRQDHVAHVFLGSRQRLLRHVFAERRQPLYRLARPMALPPIERDAFGAFIRARRCQCRAACVYSRSLSPTSSSGRPRWAHRGLLED